MTGRVVERKVELGAAVGRDNLETEIFTIADLDRVWVELAVSPADLPFIREGQTRFDQRAWNCQKRPTARSYSSARCSTRKPRSAHVVAEIDNSDGVWRPWLVCHRGIAIERDIRYQSPFPTSALQTIGGGQVVFVQTPEGFRKALR